MRTFLVLASLSLLAASAVLADEEEVTELKVETLKKADECTRGAAKGDMLTMHYKGTLTSGTEFDSRFVCFVDQLMSSLILNFPFYFSLFQQLPSRRALQVSNRRWPGDQGLGRRSARHLPRGEAKAHHSFPPRIRRHGRR